MLFCSVGLVRADTVNKMGGGQGYTVHSASLSISFELPIDHSVWNSAKDRRLINKVERVKNVETTFQLILSPLKKSNVTCTRKQH